MKDWKKSICNSPSSVNFGDANNYTEIIHSELSPIDSFYKRQKEIMAFCTPSFMTNNPTIAPLMLVGLISNVETYYRHIFAHLIRLCPIAKKNISSKTMNLSSIYFGYDFLELSTFENQSLSDSQSITKLMKTILDIDIKKPDCSIKSPLLEFQKLCELRHSIVHFNGIINSKNAIELNLSSNKNHYNVKVDFSEIQNAALICLSLICSSNIEFFEKMIDRWAHQWNNFPDYNSNKSFKKLWEIFYSKTDEINRNIEIPSTLIKTRNLVKKEYNI